MQSHMIGKWDVGYAVKECQPTFKGFDTAFYYSKACNADLFFHTDPGADRCHTSTGFEQDYSLAHNRSIHGASTFHDEPTNGTYSTHQFTRYALDIINKHEPGKDAPLYLYIAPQVRPKQERIDLACRRHSQQAMMCAPGGH